eukprot:TRINITY_DN2552_c0_g2_i1.p1 TRINITY_DN2552_c0_g2~~TRINITY_DN2552_c0_g2_i1.p1  ORF type:complete len:647 (+),score=140.98 TRINITY_DN2552_c0_g2_i1:72-1943(+)
MPHGGYQQIPRSKSPPPNGLGLSWHGITYDVKIGKGKAKTDENGWKRILNGVSGQINSGRLCCIMGPSGAGKSSLLNVLAGRVCGSNKQVDGDMRLNGKPLDARAFREKVAYVMQEDALFATQTPTEALNFSASLRNPGMSMDEQDQLVNETLEKLRLDKCRDTFAGSMTIPGLSGGEKKRTAIGIELVSDPSYLFLDEPTSGLDSYAAYIVCEMLRKLANGEYDGVQRVVVATIHQPSSEVFELFDDVILMSAGHTVYNGPRPQMSEHFDNCGYPAREGHNPADHVMFTMQLEDPNSGHKLLSQYWKETKNEQTDHLTSSQLRNSTGEEGINKKAKAGYVKQFGTLARREGMNVLRDKGALIARFGTTIFINLIVGFVFKGVGGASFANWGTEDGTANHFGALAQLAIGGMFGLAQPLLLSFPLERPVFLREYATGTYDSIPYFISKLLVEIPITILQSTVMYLVTYWLMELNGNFVYLTLATSLLGLVAASTAILIGSVSSNPQMAIQLSPLLFVPQILFSGFFISTSFIPSYLRWAQYLCSLKYGINLMMIAEFRDLPHISDLTPEQQWNVTFIRDSLLSKNDVVIDHEWLYVGIMVGVFVVFRAIACVVLAKKGSTLSA